MWGTRQTFVDWGDVPPEPPLGQMVPTASVPSCSPIILYSLCQLRGNAFATAPYGPFSLFPKLCPQDDKD